jgi:hypothetical protein
MQPFKSSVFTDNILTESEANKCLK